MSCHRRVVIVRVCEKVHPKYRTDTKPSNSQSNIQFDVVISCFGYGFAYKMSASMIEVLGRSF